MTREEALDVLGTGNSWIDWDDDLNQPDWGGDRITLDGSFSKDELLAILFFHPDNLKEQS